MGARLVKAVFTTKIEPTYDDLPELRYHFPRTYLRQVEAAVGDWIIYYEPRRVGSDAESRGGRQSYFATARVVSIQPDPTLSNHFYALVADFTEFNRPVSFKQGERYFETGLRRDDGATNKGAFGRAVRSISDIEYEQILRAGFTDILGSQPIPEMDFASGPAEEPGMAERPIIERLIARPF
jgi:putative restriction endonuclease